MIDKIKYHAKRFGASRTVGTAAMAICLAVILFLLSTSIKKVTVNDGSSTKTVYSLKTEAADLLKLASLESGSYKITDFIKTDHNINISLSYTFPVYVTVGQKTTTVNFCKGGTVTDAILQAGFVPDNNDIINMPANQILLDTAYIDVIDIEYVTSTKQQTVAYATKTVYSKTTTGTKVTVKGANGLKQVTTVTKYVNGKAESTEVIAQKTIKPAVTRVITVGTKKKSSKTVAATIPYVKCISTLKPSKPIELDKNGNPIKYKKHVTVQATAYTGSKGASGMKLQPGCVAINTKLYPYGTKFFIKSSDGKFMYGYAIAADTGAFVKKRPTNFDLVFATYKEACKFGRRNIEVYVLY